MVALVFAEAASHYPLAGGVYQWAKRFMGGTYGWWVAWMFAVALLVTVAAVAFGVAPIVCSLMGWQTTHGTLLWIAVCFALGPMLLNIYSVKVTAFFNNIGTVTEIIGLVVIAIALYVAVIIGHGPHQSLGVLFDTTPGAGNGALFGYGSLFLASMLTGAWVMYGFDTAGGLAEETVNPTRAVPRAMLFGDRHHGGHQRLLAGRHGAGDPGRRQDAGAGHRRDRLHLQRALPDLGDERLPHLGVRRDLRLLPGHPGGDDPSAVRLRPRQDDPGLEVLRVRAPEDEDADDVGDLHRPSAAIVVLLYVNLGGGDPFIQIARVTAWATAGTYIAYQMVVLGGLIARGKGWPKDKAYFNLGRWGWPVNIIALVYGVFMIVNLSWPRSRRRPGYDNYIVAALARRGRGRRHHRLRHPAGARRRPQRHDPRDRAAGSGQGGR